MLFHTGDVPTQALMRDTNNLRELPFVGSFILWTGCLDAPGYMPAGSTRGVECDGKVYPSSRTFPRTGG